MRRRKRNKGGEKKLKEVVRKNRRWRKRRKMKGK